MGYKGVALHVRRGRVLLGHAQLRRDLVLVLACAREGTCEEGRGAWWQSHGAPRPPASALTLTDEAEECRVAAPAQAAADQMGEAVRVAGGAWRAPLAPQPRILVVRLDTRDVQVLGSAVCLFELDEHAGPISVTLLPALPSESESLPRVTRNLSAQAGLGQQQLRVVVKGGLGVDSEGPGQRCRASSSSWSLGAAVLEQADSESDRITARGLPVALRQAGRLGHSGSA